MPGSERSSRVRLENRRPRQVGFVDKGMEGAGAREAAPDVPSARKGARMKTIGNEEMLQVSRELLDAEQKCVPVVALSERYPGLTLEQAYAIHMKTIEARVHAGARIIGTKVAFTSNAVQQQFGMGEPAAGMLYDHRVFREGSPVPFDSLIQPRMEPEIACVLGEDLPGPGVTLARAIQAVAGVMPAIEIVDCRCKDWKVSAADVVADSVGGWGVVLGGKMTPIAGLDLRLVGCVLEKNGVIVSTGAGAAVLGNPIESLVWAANKLSEFGMVLRKGQVVITGSLVKPESVARGDCFTATFDRIGSVSVLFA